MKKVLVVGGSNGTGLAITTVLKERADIEHIYVVDKARFPESSSDKKIEYIPFDLTEEDYSIFDRFDDIDWLVITSGFGRLKLFEDVEESEIESLFRVNSIAPIRIIKHFYPRLQSTDDFYCGVMVSIAGYLSSPFFSVYAATKASLRSFIESVNVELEKTGSKNKILNVSPGSIKGTSFTNQPTDITLLRPLAEEIVSQMEQQKDLYIPEYENVYKEVLRRYQEDFRAEGRRSFDYKITSGRAQYRKKESN